MSKITKTLTLMLTLLIVSGLILAGCGSEQAKTTAANSTAASSPAASQSPLSTQKPTLKLGVIVPLSGANAFVGAENKNAISMYLDEVNARPDYPVKLEAVFTDDQGDVNQAVSCATKLATQDKVAAVIGPWSSTCTAAASTYLETLKIPSMSVGAGVDTLTKRGLKYYFRATGNNSMQGQRVPIYLATVRNWKNVIVVYQQTDYGVTILKQVKETGPRVSMTVSGEFAYDLNTTDFTSLLAKLKGMTYDGIIMGVSSPEEISNFIKQASELGMDVSKFFGVGVDVGKVASLVGATANGYSSNANFDNIVPTTEVGKKFVTDYKTKYNTTPSLYACQGREVCDVFVQAIKLAATKDSEGITNALKSNTFTTMYGTVKFDATNENFVSFIIQQIVDGKVKTTDTKQYDAYKTYYVEPTAVPSASPSASK